MRESAGIVVLRQTYPSGGWDSLVFRHSAQLWVRTFQVREDLEVALLIWIAGGYTLVNAPDANAHLSADLQQLQPNGVTLGLGELRAL